MSYLMNARYRKKTMFEMARRIARRALREEASKATFTKHDGCLEISFSGVHPARAKQAQREVRKFAQQQGRSFVGGILA